MNELADHEKRCSFCLTPREELTRLVASENCSICEDCASIFHSELDDDIVARMVGNFEANKAVIAEKCSFCGDRYDLVLRLSAGKSTSTFICDDCVTICLDAMRKEEPGWRSRPRMNPSIIGKDASRELVKIGALERRSGLYVLGKPGMGKTSLLVQLILSDIEHRHGLFFLDPHGDATKDVFSRVAGRRILDTAYLLDPAHEQYTFGINLLACSNTDSFEQRMATYDRCRTVFDRVFSSKEAWGPLLQLVIEYTLPVFIENQDYTLAEMPLFLRDSDFRRHLLQSVKYNSEARDFWEYEFPKREREQEELVGPANRRVRILLGDQRVGHIIGQTKTTLDFTQIMQEGHIVILRLSASLAPDIKGFIGTILLSELVRAVRSREEGGRRQFSVFVDEFQNFSGSEDLQSLITEARKYGIATTLAHQERYGQLAEKRGMLGATAAAANKIFFQLTVADAQELAPEFVSLVREEKTPIRSVMSPHPVEDIWERGHADQKIMHARERHFWFVDLLRTNPHEKIYEFNPNRIQKGKYASVELDYGLFSDWHTYAATPEMLREGLSILNNYYYRKMQGEFDDLTSHIPLVGLFVTLMQKWGGIFGLHPTVEAYISSDLAQLLVQKFNEQNKQNLRNYQYDWEHGNAKYNYKVKMQIEGGYSADWVVDRHPEEYRDRWIAEKHPEVLREWTVSDLPDLLYSRENIDFFKRTAISLGVMQFDSLLEWRPRTGLAIEHERLTTLIRHAMALAGDQQTVFRQYCSAMATTPMILKFGKDHANLPEHVTTPYMTDLIKRYAWHAAEIVQFICEILIAGIQLAKQPITMPDPDYELSRKRERSQVDLLSEMEIELTRAPRFTAFTKILEEKEGKQTVLTRKVETIPLPMPLPVTDGIGERLAFSHAQQSGMIRERAEIEREVRERRGKWRGGGKLPDPPAGDPPTPWA